MSEDLEKPPHQKKTEYFEIPLPNLRKINPFDFKQFNIFNFSLVILLMVTSFALGSLYTKTSYLEKVQGLQANNLGNQAQPTPVPVAIEDIKALFADNKNLVFGDKNSKTLIVEVADPSCPYCHVVAGTNAELNKQMGPNFTLSSDGGKYLAPLPKIKELVDQGKAAFVWLYTSGHGNGEMGSLALYCANESGKFWEVHNRLFSNEGYTILNDQVQNDRSKSQELADFLSEYVDPSTMKSCIESKKYDSYLAETSATAAKLGVSGTPGFFVNTQRFPGAYSWDAMAKSLQ